MTTSVPVSAPASAPPISPRGPRARVAAAVAVLLVAALLAAGTAGWWLVRGAAVRPLTPQAAVDAVFDAARAGDAETSWELMCREQQRERGPRDRYLREAADQARGIDQDELFRATVAGVQPVPSEGRGAFAVLVAFTGPGGPQFAELALVVWERDAFRECGFL
ncbi:hypothetical protein [Blastococcus sp. SYSU D00695]